MNRRNFLTALTPIIATPILLDGMRLNAFAKSGSMDSLLSATTDTDHVMVLIQLNGGNDGLNTLIPMDQYSSYFQLRQNIAIKDSDILKINDTTGFHPSMTGFERLYKDGLMAVVQNVGYPNPNLSHFRATDIWLTASNSNEYLQTGWAGRYLDTEYADYPDINDYMPDPVAIQIGATVSLSLQGSKGTMGMAIQDPNTFYQLVNGTSTGPFGPPPDNRYGRELQFIRDVQISSQIYSKQIKNAADKAQNQAEYPAQNRLADQLKIVARLIAGGLLTRIYVVNLGGFDTHSAQVDISDTKSGTHANLLATLSSAAESFQSDLKLLGVDKRVVSMTFSEFGRRVASNGSLGTDHGTSAPMFVFGSNVNGNVFGANPNLSDLDNGNLKMQFDFRQIYSSLLTQWFNINNDNLDEVLFRQFNQLPIIRTSTSVSNIFKGNTNLALYPNPTSDFLNIKLPENIALLNSKPALIRIFSTSGNQVFQNDNIRFGLNNEIRLDLERIPSGSYIFSLEISGTSYVMPFIIER